MLQTIVMVMIESIYILLLQAVFSWAIRLFFAPSVRFGKCWWQIQMCNFLVFVFLIALGVPKIVSGALFLTLPGVLTVILFGRTHRIRKLLKFGVFFLIFFILLMEAGVLDVVLTGHTRTSDRECIMAGCLLYILYLCRKNRHRMFRELTFSVRELSSVILLLIADMLVFGMLLTGGEPLRGFGVSAKIGREVANTVSILMLFFTIFFFGAFVKGKNADYYRAESKEHRRYIEAQLEYFESYKAAQAETIRFRHDMKNHLLTLQSLGKEKKFDTMMRYFDTLLSKWEHTQTLLHTGDDIVDAIVHAKRAALERAHIALRVEGHFIGGLAAPAVDIGTIFANAIDNAEEANRQIADPSDRFLQIRIKSNENFYVITFENPMPDTGKPSGAGKLLEAGKLSGGGKPPEAGKLSGAGKSSEAGKVPDTGNLHAEERLSGVGKSRKGKWISGIGKPRDAGESSSVGKPRDTGEPSSVGKPRDTGESSSVGKLRDVRKPQGDRLPSTTKKEPGHGFGLINIRQAAEENHGCMRIRTDARCFYLNIILPHEAADRSHA